MSKTTFGMSDLRLPFIAIPTLGRSDTITQKTLKYLKKSGYPAEKIHLFVANHKEFDIYTKIPKDLYGEIIVGCMGLKEQKNFITSFYPEDEIIIQMDDDVKAISGTQPFLDLVKMGVDMLSLRTGGLWGIMPNNDTRRFKPNTTTHLSFIIGCFFIMRNHKSIKITYSEKDDVERSILYFKRYGQVFRYQGSGVDTGYGKGEGGLQTPGRAERRDLEVARFQTEYPEYVSVVDKKGIKDIILNWRAKTNLPETTGDRQCRILSKVLSEGLYPPSV